MIEINDETQEMLQHPLSEDEFIRLQAVKIVYAYHYDEAGTNLSYMAPEIRKVANYIKTGKLTNGDWGK